MIKNNLKTILFASLVVTMVLPFGAMEFAEAEENDRNPRDKTLERMQEKEDREQVIKRMTDLGKEKADLKKKLESETDSNGKVKIESA